MNLPNPYEAPQGEIPPQGISWREKLSAFKERSRVGWGATICFWALVAYLCFNIGVSFMMPYAPFETSFSFYYPLRFYGTLGAVILQSIGLLLLCYIGEKTQAKTIFKLALGCLLAYEAWNLVQYFETQEQREASTVPPIVSFLAQLTWVLSPLFLFIALRRVSIYTNDRLMLRWSLLAQFLYTLMTILIVGVLALYLLTPGIVTDLCFKYRLEYSRIFELGSNAIKLIGIPVAYCYARLLVRMTALWEQKPAAEVDSDGDTMKTNPRVEHEPESA